MDVLVERFLRVPCDEVTAYAFDWRHDAEWTQGIREARLHRPDASGGFGVGAQVARTAYFLGRRIDYVLEVEALSPTCMEMRSVAGPFPMHVTYRFEREGDGTRGSIRVQGGSGLMGRLGAPMVRRNLAKDLRDLEQNLS